MSKENKKLHDKVVVKERRRIRKLMKEGVYVEMLRKENGVMDEKEMILDNEFLSDMMKEIERNREKRIVYEENFKDWELEEWRRYNFRKTLGRKIRKRTGREN